MDNLSIIIPSAGLSRRMKSYGPKSLINLGGGNIVLTRQLNIIRYFYPLAEIILVLGFQAEKVYKIIPSDVRVIENRLFESTNVAYSIQLGIDYATYNNILVIYGDLAFNENALNFPLISSCVITDKNNYMKDAEVGVTVIDNVAQHFCYGLNDKWAQIMYLTGRELELYKKNATKNQSRRYYGYEILNMILVSGGEFLSYSPPGMKIMDIDNANDIATAKIMIKENK